MNKIINIVPAARQRRYPAPPSTVDIHDNAVPIRSERMIHAFADKPGKVFLLYGERAIFQLSLQMAAHAMVQGNPIAVVDGCNRFDVYALSRFARTRKIDPNKFLNHIFISRGFTCYQMEQAIAHKLPAFLATIHSNTALVFGLLDTFYDEQASLREVRQILQRLLGSFQEMKSKGVSLLLVCLERTVAPQERNQLFTTLKNGVDRVYKLDTNERGSLQLYLESQQPVHEKIKGVLNYGTNRTHLHQPDRCGTGKLVKVPPRTA
ncbi:MAG: hypothetical protein ABSA44_01860 [Bacteroidota bacterium]|jgi:hypothetical protein